MSNHLILTCISIISTMYYTEFAGRICLNTQAFRFYIESFSFISCQLVFCAFICLSHHQYICLCVYLYLSFGQLPRFHGQFVLVCVQMRLSKSLYIIDAVFLDIGHCLFILRRETLLLVREAAKIVLFLLVCPHQILRRELYAFTVHRAS